MMTTWCLRVCGLNSWVICFDVKTHDIWDRKRDNKEGGGFNWEHPVPRVLVYKRRSDITEVHITEFRVYKHPIKKSTRTTATRIHFSSWESWVHNKVLSLLTCTRPTPAVMRSPLTPCITAMMDSSTAPCRKKGFASSTDTASPSGGITDVYFTMLRSWIPAAATTTSFIQAHETVSGGITDMYFTIILFRSWIPAAATTTSCIQAHEIVSGESPTCISTILFRSWIPAAATTTPFMQAHMIVWGGITDVYFTIILFRSWIPAAATTTSILQAHGLSQAESLMCIFTILFRSWTPAAAATTTFIQAHGIMLYTRWLHLLPGLA
jgi:hypothetical protein